MRWSGALTEGSVVALLAAVVSQLLGWSTARTWFLLVWAILLLPVMLGLFAHPMRWPAWGLFVGFWGTVGAVFLVVIQVLAVSDLLREPAYGAWAPWPLAVVGIWTVVASGLGLGAEGFPRVVDGFGILTGGGLIAISVLTWANAGDATRVAALVAAAAFCIWAAALGVVYWRIAPTISMERQWS